LFQAKQLVTEAVAKLEQITARLPRAGQNDAGLRLRLDYLAVRADELAAMQDEVHDQLLPLPAGAAGVAMLRQEVSQALFTRVMNLNPSRNQGRGLPVDSVSYDDAEEFCRRLGWVLGAAVRLPTAEEFRTAAGPVPGEPEESAWCAGNSGGRPHPGAQKKPSPAGFFDLRGNLEEWLRDEDLTDETAPRAGGSFATAAADLAAETGRSAPRAERTRTTGFRIVVEFGPGG
jgi:formylglycine-generating enzyme required for sulfatase activity